MFMNRLSLRLGSALRVVQGVRQMHTGSPQPNFDYFIRMPTLDTQYCFQPEVFKKLLVRTGSPKAQALTKPAPTEDVMMDANTAALFTNLDTSLLLDSIDMTAQYDNVLQCTSVLRKRRSKMNKHKLKKRRRRERFSTRKTTTV